MSSPTWDLCRPEQLGSLGGPPDSPYTAAEMSALHAAVAQILVRAAGADLVFVGRSPEPLQYYLAGLCCSRPVEWQVRTLNVSLLHRSLSRRKRLALRPLPAQAGLHPYALVAQDRRAVLVDVVASGGSLPSCKGRPLPLRLGPDQRAARCLGAATGGVDRSAPGREKPAVSLALAGAADFPGHAAHPGQQCAAARCLLAPAR